MPTESNDVPSTSAATHETPPFDELDGGLVDTSEQTSSNGFGVASDELDAAFSAETDVANSETPAELPVAEAGTPTSFGESTDAAPDPVFGEAGSAGPGAQAPGVWATLSLDGSSPTELRFEEAVSAYTRDPNQRMMVSIIASHPTWGTLKLDVSSIPGPVSAGPYTCEAGVSLISATMLTDTGIRSLASDGSAAAGCSIVVIEPGEAEGLPFAGTFEATLVATTGEVLTITDGGFWGALNE